MRSEPNLTLKQVHLINMVVIQHYIIQTLMPVDLHHFASKLMEMPKLRHIQTQITQQVAKCVHLLDYLHTAQLPKFKQALVKISSNPGLTILLVIHFALLLVFALNPQQDPIILTC